VPLTNPNQIIVTEVFTGGPYSFDPAIDYESLGMEVILNVYQTLIQYNGSSTSQLNPIIATEIPTVANGGISNNYLNYTFYIRSGLKFSNGDPVTAWDAYISFIRTLLFVQDSPGTAGWILAQDLLLAGGFAPGATSYQNITSAITVDNSTQTVTFHLLKPDPAFLDYLADPEAVSIMDYSWLVAHGAGITFTPSGFSAYINEGNETGYNTYVQYNAMGSGPYMIKNYLIGQAVSYSPNPYYSPIPGIPGYEHAANDTIYVQYEKDPSTGLLIAESGQTDIVEGLPNVDYPIIAHLQSEGKINITSFPTISINFFDFNFNINTTMLSSLGPGYNVPQYYFTNLDVRRAWAYAFNYTNFIDNLLGNSKYGADFGFHFTGMIPIGMVGYLNVSQLLQAGAVVPTYNLAIAKQDLEESGLYNTTINMPIIVDSSDTINYAAATDWASAMNSIDANIHASVLYMVWDQIEGYGVAGQNPMPIYTDDWGPDYPFPSDYIVPMYQEDGYYGYANSWNPQVLAASGQQNESLADALMNQYIAEAENTGNATLAIKYYDQAEVLGVNLTLYTYTYQANAFWIYSTLIHGFQNEVNPIYGGDDNIIYLFLSK
jgi:ABC-type transport system substrate-binding protein